MTAQDCSGCGDSPRTRTGSENPMADDAAEAARVEVASARRVMELAREQYLQRAGEYRSAVREVQLLSGLSVRATARELDLDESTVRELLGRRPDRRQN